MVNMRRPSDMIDVFAFPLNPEAGLLKSPNRALVVHTRYSGHLNRYFDLSNLGALKLLLGNSKVCPDGVLNIVQSFLFVAALRPAAGKPWNRNTDTPLLSDSRRYGNVGS